MTTSVIPSMTRSVTRSMTHARRVSRLTPWLLAAGMALSTGCSTRPTAVAASTPDAIYSGGDILTMAGATPQYVEALAIGGGRILGAGTRADMMKLAGPATRQFDLQGQTLMPALQITTSLIGLGLAALILVLLRRDHLYIHHGLFWIVVAALGALLGLWPGLIDRVAQLVGISYAPAALLLGAVVVEPR